MSKGVHLTVVGCRQAPHPRAHADHPGGSCTFVSHCIQDGRERESKITLGRDSCMFHVTTRTLRNVGCGSSRFWGRRARKRLNRAVKDVSKNCGRKAQKARLVARVGPQVVKAAAFLG